jgi:hypothetical protein
LKVYMLKYLMVSEIPPEEFHQDEYSKEFPFFSIYDNQLLLLHLHFHHSIQILSSIDR